VPLAACTYFLSETGSRQVEQELHFRIAGQ